MKKWTILTLLTLLLTTGIMPLQNSYAQSGSQSISKAGIRVSTTGPAEYFTGRVRVEPLFQSGDSTPFTAAYVTFEPGARSAWHIHPSGQHLVVTAGVGRTGYWAGNGAGSSGSLVEEIGAGDVIWCPPGVKHWHGASPTSSMTHLAITGVGINPSSINSVNWMEKVTDEEYNGRRAGIIVPPTRTQTMNTDQSLSAKQQCIIPIAAFTAIGDLGRLKIALNEGLDAGGLTVNEVREILVQMYAYAGFPRSLNAINTFMSVLDERKAKGISDIVGKDATPLPANMNRDEQGARTRAIITGHTVIPPPTGYQVFAPIIDTYLKEHLFADIFARDILDHQSRELATNAALAAMTGTSPQLQAHLAGALNVGMTAAQLNGFVSVLRSKVGPAEADGAAALLAEVLKNRATQK